jgi:hypothetical protein
MDKDEALKLALEALTALLDEWTPARQAQLKGMEAITAIKQALAAQPAPSCPECVFGLCHCGLRKSPPAQPAPVPKCSIQHLKTMMEESAFEGRLELSDALLNIDEFYAAQPAPTVQEPVACKQLCELCVKRGYDFCANAAKTTPLPSPLAQPAPTVQKPDAMGCKCAECGAWQRWTPSGMVCKNGHGGASGINQRLYTTPPAAQPAPVHFAWMRYEEDCAGDPVLVWARSTEEGAFKVYKEPPAAQPAPVKVWEAEGYDSLMQEMQMVKARNIRQHAEIERLKAAQQALPDAMTSADIQEHIEYVAGWNDCRAEMLKGMKP